MRILNLSLLSLLLFTAIHLSSMKVGTKIIPCAEEQSFFVNLSEDIVLAIIAPCDNKDNLRKTCHYLHKLASSNNGNIFIQHSLILSDEALKRFVLYYCALGNSAVVCNLLSKGADPNASDGNKMTLLHYAAQCGYVDIVNQLLQHSALIATDIAKDENSPFALAMRYNHKIIIERIISIGLVDNSLLLHAANEGLLSMVETLLASGGDANATDHEGTSALFYATAKGHVAIMRLLIAKGAEVNCRFKNDISALHKAVHNSHTSAVHLLISNGATIDIRDGHNATPLHNASRREHEQIAKMLLNNGADVNAKTDTGETPLYCASSSLYENIKIVEMLLSNGAHVNERVNYGWTPLLVALTSKHVGIAHVLLMHLEIDVNIKYDNGRTVLHYAVGNKYTDIVYALLAHPTIDVNAKNDFDQTALHDAVWHKCADIVRALLEHPEIDVTVENQVGDTPLRYAESHFAGDDVIGKLLTEKKNDSKKDKDNCVIQ